MATAPTARAAIAPVKSGPLAVVDIGSNSIRLVVYSGLERGAVTLFNEKVLCGLGRGLAQTGMLNPDGVMLARQNLVRFTRLASAMGVARIDLLATAAVREAADGAAFKAEIEALSGHPVTVLSGPEEGRLSGLGVIAGFPGAHGVMGDMGGGSLELVELCDGRVGRSVTLPLGPFKLMEQCGADETAVARAVDERLAEVDWLGEIHDRADTAFYAVGGAWRNLARIDIEQSKYPLHVIHGYTMRRGAVDDLARLIGRQSRRSLARIRGVTKARLETLPTAATVLRRVVRALACHEVRFSGFGLREGHAFDLLPPEEQALDPLLAVCSDIAGREARFAHLGDPLMAWSDPLFQAESPEARRLRQASCLLSDIAWREHPDYRANQALFRILHFPFIGLSHAGRAWLGYAAYARYGGGPEGAAVKPYLRLLHDDDLHGARVLGLAQRLAYQLSGATREVLAHCALRLDDGRELHLILPDDGSVPVGEAVERRLIALAEALEAKAYVIGG